VTRHSRAIVAVVVIAALGIGCGRDASVTTPNPPAAPSSPSPTLMVFGSVFPRRGSAGITEFAFVASAPNTPVEAASFSWHFGDGQTGSGREVGHTFASPGAYVVVLTVTDTRHTASLDFDVQIDAVAGR
jgi:PKD repeat protein